MEAQRRNISRARRLYRAALSLDPTHARSLMALGQLEARDGNAAAAQQVGRCYSVQVEGCTNAWI